jgi:hypothetical protein
MSAGVEHAVHARLHPAELAGVDEQHLALAAAKLSVALVARQEPQADRDLRRVEQLAGHGDHAVHEVGLDELLPDRPLAGLLRRHRAVREHHAGGAGGREVVHDVLEPAKFALPAGGVPYFQRTSSARRSPPQLLMLNGGFAITKSARRSGCRSRWKVSPCCLPSLASMPRIAMFIRAMRQVVALLSGRRR